MPKTFPIALTFISGKGFFRNVSQCLLQHCNGPNGHNVNITTTQRDEWISVYASVFVDQDLAKVANFSS